MVFGGWGDAGGRQALGIASLVALTEAQGVGPLPGSV